LYDDGGNSVSVLRLERGRGVLTERTSDSQFEQGEGFWWHVDRRTPLRLGLEQGEGFWWHVDRRTPLRLGLEQGRGGRCVNKIKKTPPSRVLSEGGWRGG